MDASETVTPAAERRALLVVLGLIAVKLALHLALVDRYGYHGDELYFIECGRHLALGYVDHPPLVPWIARAADELLGASLLSLRLTAIVAGAGTMAFAALLVREWGGGWRAQLVAMLTILVAPAYLRMSAMLNIPAIEVFLCAAASYLVARALGRGERWTWLLVGAVAGLGVLAKHSTLLWGASLAVGLLATDQRRVLRTVWPWAGLAVAAAIAVPNLIWQTQHDFATLEFLRTLRGEVLAEQGRALFVAGQILYFHPLAVPIWLAGLVFALTEPGRAARPFAILFLVMFTVLLVAGGKPYYLASAYPAVLAAGGVALERLLRERARLWRGLVASLAITGAALGLLTVPALPIRTLDAAIGRVLGWIVPPIALTHDLHGMCGWREHAEAVDRAYASLAPAERAEAGVLAGSYSQAAALNVLRDDRAPRAVSGNMTYYLWGPEPGRGATLIAYGVPRALLERHYGVVDERDRIEAPLARPWDTGLPVYVCREPRSTMAELWPELRRFGHHAPSGWVDRSAREGSARSGLSGTLGVPSETDRANLLGRAELALPSSDATAADARRSTEGGLVQPALLPRPEGFFGHLDGPFAGGPIAPQPRAFRGSGGTGSHADRHYRRARRSTLRRRRRLPAPQIEHLAAERAARLGLKERHGLLAWAGVHRGRRAQDPIEHVELRRGELNLDRPALGDGTLHGPILGASEATVNPPGPPRRANRHGAGPCSQSQITILIHREPSSTWRRRSDVLTSSGSSAAVAAARSRETMG